MEYLNTLSRFWTMLHSLIFFLMLDDLRFHNRTILLSVLGMTPLLFLIESLFTRLGIEFLPAHFYLTLLLPSLLFCFIISKKRDFRFLYTFFLCYSVCFEIAALTVIIDHWLGSGSLIVSFAARIVIFLILDYLIWKYFRKLHLELLRSEATGWGLFSVMSILFFVLLFITITYPTHIVNRPQDLPETLLVFAVIPLTYVAIYRMLFGQMKHYQTDIQRQNAEKQSELLLNELYTEKEYVAKARQTYHDIRHILLVVLEYLDQGSYEEVKSYLSDYRVSIEESAMPNYCENDAANAVLHIYARRCSYDRITYEVNAVIPKTLPYSSIESGALFGNLIENAYEAAGKCSEPFIRVSAVTKNNHLYLEITNSVCQTVEFLDGLPVSTKPGGGGGIGVRSVADILSKYGGMMKMQQNGDVFITQIIQAL